MTKIILSLHGLMSMRRLLFIAALLLLAVVVYSRLRQPSSVSKEQTEPPKLAIDAQNQAFKRLPKFRPANRTSDESNLKLLDEGRMEKLREGEGRPLSALELAGYLKMNHTNAHSLVTAFEASHDKSFLREAAEKFPSDPFVQAKVLMHDIFPEDRQKWADALKKSDPDNSFPYLLSAQDLVKKGDMAGALKEINSMGARKFEDYTRQSMADLEDAYISSGRPLLESKFQATSEILIPSLASFKQAATGLLQDSAAQFGKAGDYASEAAVLKAVWEMGSQLRRDDNPVMITGLVGIAIQSMALKQWSGNGESPFPQGTVEERLAQNQALRQQVRDQNSVVDQWMPQATEPELLTYFDRMKIFGETEAIKWLQQRHPEIQPLARE
jgi:hypothetical protein